MIRGILVILMVLAAACDEYVTEEYYITVIDTDTGTDANDDPYCINGEEFCTSIYNPTCMENNNGIWVLYKEGDCVCIDGEAHREFAIQVCTDGCGIRPHGVDVCMEDLAE